MINTDEALLGRLKVENAHEAWREFFEAYWGAILRYGRKIGLTAPEAEEVLQETMVALMRVLPEFAYDPGKGRFRNFLLTIVHRKALAALRRRRQQPAVVSSEVLEGEMARLWGDDESAEREARSRWRDSLMEEAMRRLRDDVRMGEHTVAVFEAYVIQRQPAAEVARRFGLKENAVYQIGNRVTRRLKSDVAQLMKNSGME